jgi:hypothetical protein
MVGGRGSHVIPASTPSPLVRDISRASVCHYFSLRASDVNATTSDGGRVIVVLVVVT